MRFSFGVVASSMLTLIAATQHLSAQSALVTGEVSSSIVVSNPATLPATPWTDAMYLADRSAGSNYSGVVNLIFNRVGGGSSACTGSNLGGGKILTAAHCVSNGTSLTSTSFTARFYEMGLGWVDVTGTGYAVKAGYNGTVVQDNDVAVLTLSAPAPAWARTYSLASGSILGQTQTFAGYGLVGNGLYGDQFSSSQFTDAAVLRFGQNVFETTCITGFTCATSANAAPGEFGGILLSDLDRSGISSAGTLCNSLGFCSAGLPDFREVTTGRGDSGGAAFLNDWTISGVASFGQSSNGILGGFGFAEGHTCVANIANNSRCQSNFEFVNSQVVPEPATTAMLAFGLLAIAGVVRRKRTI